MDNLDVDDEDEASEDMVSPGPADMNADPTPDQIEDSEGSTEDTASDSDAWSDSSDDEDHILVRTTSGRPLATIVEAKSEIKQAIVESGDDYFGLSQHNSTPLQTADSTHRTRPFVGDDKETVDLKAAASSVVELLAEFGYEDLPSPSANEAVAQG